jgi:hypothetical protein
VLKNPPNVTSHQKTLKKLFHLVMKTNFGRKIFAETLSGCGARGRPSTSIPKRAINRAEGKLNAFPSAKNFRLFWVKTDGGKSVR